MQPVEKASLTDWLAVVAGAIGAFMASLDISITNAALPQIQGEIGASGTEGTWISTGYLVFEVIIIPLSAWMSRVLGLRNLLLSAATLFTLFSLLCGVAHDLPTMIIGRMGQGFTGGALIPTAQTIMRTRLPRHQLPLGMSLFGFIVLMAPILGPVLGGWLTENVTWQWCFFLNLPVCVALVTLVVLGLPRERMQPALFFNADWLGIAGLACFLGSLTIILEEGQRERWFESPMIVHLSVVCAVGLVMLVVTQFTCAQPVLKLRLFRNPSFAGVICIVTTTGTALYSMLYVLPQFLGSIAGYNAQQAGRVLFISGVPALMLMPVVPLLLARVSTRNLMLCGLSCFAASCFMDVDVTSQSDGDTFLLSQLLRGLGQILSMMPLNQAAVGSVAMEDTADASGLYNMARNLGGSLGLAGLGIFIDRRTEFHADTLRERVSANAPAVQSYIGRLAERFLQGAPDVGHARAQAEQLLAGQIHLQALVMTYADCFWVLGALLLAALPLVFMLRMPQGLRRGGAQEAH